MRKLLIGILVTAFGLFIFAGAQGSQTLSANWSISSMFVFKLDEKGIDIDHTTNITVSVSFAQNPQQGKVTAHFSWVDGGALSFAGVDFSGEKVKIVYKPSAVKVDKYFFNVGTDYIAVSPATGLTGLTVYYADIVNNEVNIDDTDNSFAKSWFDDAVFVKYSMEDLSGFKVNLVGGFYDTDNASTTNAYEFGGVLYANGKEGTTFEKLSVEAAFASLASGGNAYGVDVSYSYTMNVSSTSITLTLAPEFKYTENLTKMKYVNTNPKAGPVVKDEKFVKSDVKLSASFKPVDLTLTLTPDYKIDKSSFSMLAEVKAEYKVPNIDAAVTFSIPDVMATSLEWTLTANLNEYKFNLDEEGSKSLTLNAGFTYPSTGKWDLTGGLSLNAVKDLTLAANFEYDSAGNFAYNASADYTIEEGLKAKFFYGTLYDSDGDGTLDMNVNAPQWWLKVYYNL